MYLNSGISLIILRHEDYDCLRTVGVWQDNLYTELPQGKQEKAVVLVNDFGKAGIDGEILSSSGIESIELPSGCVCCTLKTDLITTIEKIISTFAPEHLIIEPSGVASPSGVLEALDLLKITPVMVIGIVDATRIHDFYELRFTAVFSRTRCKLRRYPDQ